MTGRIETHLVYGTGFIVLVAAAGWLTLGGFFARNVQGAPRRRSFALAAMLTAIAFGIAELFLVAAAVGRSWPPLPWLIPVLAAVVIPLWIRQAGRARNIANLPHFRRRSATNGTIFILAIALALEATIFNAFRHPWVGDALFAVCSAAMYFGNREARRNRATLSGGSRRR